MDIQVHTKPTLCSSNKQYSHQESGRNQVDNKRVLEATSLERCFLVSDETWESLRPFGKARPYFHSAHPPFLPSCAKSSGPGSWLEMVFSEVRRWGSRGLASSPSQYHALQSVGASGPVSPPFGFLLLLLAFFRNLLSFETMKGRKTKSEWALLLPASLLPCPCD